MKSRIFYDVAVLFTIFLLPWWCSLVLIMLGIFLFKSLFFEGIIFGLMLDALYVPPTTLFFIIVLPYIFTTTTTIFVLFSSTIKKQLRIYNV